MNTETKFTKGPCRIGGEKGNKMTVDCIISYGVDCITYQDAVTFSRFSKQAWQWWRQNIGSHETVIRPPSAYDIMERMLSDGLVLQDMSSGRVTKRTWKGASYQPV